VNHFSQLIAIGAMAMLTAHHTAADPIRATLPDPRLDALVAAALANAPDVAAARAELAASRLRVEPARTLPDPMLTTSYQNDGRAFSLGAAEGSFFGLMLSQALPWPGKLDLAAKSAASEAAEVEAGPVARAALGVEARVRTAWYDLLLARALDRLVDERRETARQIEATTRERYAAGLAAQQDVLRAQTELSRMEELKATQRATIASRVAELDRLAGHTPDQTGGDLPPLTEVPAVSDLVAGALQRSPEVAAARQAMRTNRLRADLAKKNFLPDFVVSGGSMYRGSFAMGPMWQIGAGISIPLHLDKRQRNALAEAEKRVDEQEARMKIVEREIELRTRERVAQLESANEIATLDRQKIIPLDQLSYESALAGYRAGKLPFIALFDAVNALYADRAAYLTRLAEAAKWRVAIDEGSPESRP